MAFWKVSYGAADVSILSASTVVGALDALGEQVVAKQREQEVALPDAAGAGHDLHHAVVHAVGQGPDVSVALDLHSASVDALLRFGLICQ